MRIGTYRCGRRSCGEAAIEEKLATTNYGDVLAARGVTTVALNEHGEIVEHRPDGSSVVLEETH